MKIPETMDIIVPTCSKRRNSTRRASRRPSSSHHRLLFGIILLLSGDGANTISRTVAQTCSSDLSQSCEIQGCCSNSGDGQSQPQSYNCSLPGLETFAPLGGQYEGVQVNYLSFVTETSSPNLPVRAKEFEACTGGTIVFSEANNVWEDPIREYVPTFE